MKRLTYVWSTIGLLILFAVFLMFQMPGMPAWGTVKLTDILMIIGGLLFIVPIYMDSLRRKDGDGAPNRWVWATLPPVGMAVVCIGILIPNTVGFFSLFPLADVFYLVGCPADAADRRLPAVRPEPRGAGGADRGYGGAYGPLTGSRSWCAPACPLARIPWNA